ncbi:mannan endo-1,4-beta-mannosidase (GH26) [Formosa agariphila KMM 3901]|uniref:Mannan endo-1,4-beta-mannosidase (GH26) n=2 Tax=Formosa TaxID=225842 RepID=T2KQ15_FORAG|nr:mannan endo-1,4-beta-mannosidase (GH26) [Formosa agariphila KMM 3901]
MGAVLLGCAGNKSVVSYKTKKAPKLLKKLKKDNHKGVMLGHEDALAYGIGWKHTKIDSLQSDVKKATNKFPVVMGWDLGGIGDAANLDGVSFNDMKLLAIQSHEKGAINTFNWHPFIYSDTISSWDTSTKIVETILPGGNKHQALILKLDQIATFISSLKTKSNKSIPVIFRPWHEMNGTWFWWGKDYCTPEEYKALFKFTVDYLKRDKGLDNLIIAYSPDRQFYTEKQYLEWYPGDAYVDILGVDNYYDFTENGDGLQAVINKLNIVVGLADERGKLAAFTETGSDKLLDSAWFTDKLSKVLIESELYKKISYVLLWRNRDEEHFYVPYKGHPAFQDFIEFTKNENILLLK